MPEDDLSVMPRDSSGKFLSEEELEKRRNRPPVENLADNAVHVKKAHDENTLLDVRVNNPLKKIISLLEDIKKQKAFSFTLKGSLGIMGIVLALSLFGLFGGSKMLCDKGTQSQIGVVKMLQMIDVEVSAVPFIGPLIDSYNEYFRNPYAAVLYRTVLIQDDGRVIYLPLTAGTSIQSFAGYRVIATGQYDSCSQVLKITNPQGIQLAD